MSQSSFFVLRRFVFRSRRWRIHLINLRGRRRHFGNVGKRWWAISYPPSLQNFCVITESLTSISKREKRWRLPSCFQRLAQWLPRNGGLCSFDLFILPPGLITSTTNSIIPAHKFCLMISIRIFELLILGASLPLFIESVVCYC